MAANTRDGLQNPYQAWVGRFTLGALLATSVATGVVQASPTGPIAEAAHTIQHAADDHRLILLGELHGTSEVPRVVADLLSDYAAQGPVLLGIEVPASEQAALTAYLSSDGTAKARRKLRAGPFWHAQDLQHDGRRNYDMLDLIEKVRLLHRRGRNVEILAYDNPVGTRVSSTERDADMAARIRTAFATRMHGRLIILAGNVHAMLQRPSYAPREMQPPMGSHLRDLDSYSINITARRGESWACTSHCGPLALPKMDDFSGPESDGTYDFQIVLPRFTVARLIGKRTPQGWR